jgi:hypothetical protein
VQDVERGVVAGAELHEELLVGTQPQEGRRHRWTTEPCWVMDG